MTTPNTRRMITAGALEFRSSSDGVTLEGYASTFNQPYDMGWYTEQVAPGSFTKTLSEQPDVRALINHDGLPLARTKSGTLQLSQDSTGLAVRAVLDPNDPDVQRIQPKIDRGDLDEMSFAFMATRQAWNEDYTERELQEISLANGDVSIVTYPANPNTSFSLRAKALIHDEPEKIRALYREITAERSGARSKLAGALETLGELNDDEAIATITNLLDGSALRSAEIEQEETKPGHPLRLARARIALATLKR